MEQLYILIIILEIFSSIFFFALRSVNFIKGPPFVLTCMDGEKIIAIKNQLVMDRVPETWVLEVLWRNGFKASWTGFFFIFCQIFGIFDDFLK